MKAHLVKTLYFEAAHRNAHGNEAQQRLHGHSYKVDLLGGGAPSPEIGWVVDFVEFKRLFQPLYEQLDHAYLNELHGLEQDTRLPALREWMLQALPARPPWFWDLRLSIAGDCAFRATKLPADPFADLPERIRFTTESAQSLPQLPSGHPCRKIHGHSYRFELGATDTAGLQAVLGTLYETLDHRYLNEVPGLECATCERICVWLWEWVKQRGLEPTVTVVQETETARCIYYGE